MFAAQFAGLDVPGDLGFKFIGKLKAVAAEYLDTVVVEGIVRGGDHEADVRIHGPGQMGDSGGWYGTDEHDIDTHGDQAAGECGFKHVSGQTGVFPNDSLAGSVPRGSEHMAQGFTHLKRHFRRDGITIGAPSDSIRSK